jgi:hypothetical protein
MWIANFENGCFEADTLEQLSNQIAEFYAQDNMWLPDAESVENDNQTLSELGLQKFNEACENQYEAEVEEIEWSQEYRRQVEADYYANIL